jgi:hypothetical protein
MSTYYYYSVIVAGEVLEECDIYGSVVISDVKTVAF